jgi:GTP-binding protein Era
MSTPESNTRPPSSRQQCGYVAIVGRPNVGKSTLLNGILGTKLSITSRKPQTTRHAILGIKTTGPVQAIYVDTPGLQHQQKKKIHRIMNRTAIATAQDVDVILFVVDGLVWNDADQHVLQALAEIKAPVILVINKVDRLTDKTVLLPHMEKLSGMGKFSAIIPLSALSPKDVQRLEQEIMTLLPENTHLFAEDELTDRSERFLVGEIIREKIIRQLGDEIPYEVAVEVESFSDKPHLVEIHAVILVEKEGQKRIVIGSLGSRIKQIGEQARHDIEALLQKKVLLKLWVKIKAGWSDNDRALKSLDLE